MKKLFLMFAVAGLIASCTGNGNTSGSTTTSGENKDGRLTGRLKKVGCLSHTQKLRRAGISTEDM